MGQGMGPESHSPCSNEPDYGIWKFTFLVISEKNTEPGVRSYTSKSQLLVTYWVILNKHLASLDCNVVSQAAKSPATLDVLQELSGLDITRFYKSHS